MHLHYDTCNNRLGKISTLSDTIPQAIFSQLTEPRRWARPGAFGKYSESSGVAHIAEIIDVRLDKPSNRNVYSLLGDAAVVLDMETQRPRYLYCDLFSMGVLVDDDSVGLANTAIVGRDLTPVPFLRPIRDPLDSILRVNGWPRHSSTPSWLRKEKRSGDDLIKFNFFMESLKMFSSNDINDNIPFVNSSQTRPGSASLRPSSMYKNKNSTDSTGMAYWEEWEREIPTASLNGIKPSTPTIAIVVGRGCSPGGRRPGSAEPVAGLNSEVIMGVFPTKPPPLAVKEEVCLDKVMFSRPRSPDPVMSTVAEVESTKTATNWFEGDSRSTKGWVGSSTGVSSGESTLPPGSPRWLRRHLWSIPRVLMWCADSMSDLEQSGRLRTMTGYAALQREKRELKEGLSPDTETVEELDDIECTSRPATRAVSPRKAINRAVTASARLDIVHQVRSKLNSSGHVAQQTPRSPNKVATLQSPRPQSPFFTNQHQSYAILKQEMFLETIFDDASASTAPRPKTATAIMTKMDKESIHYVGIGEAPASPIIGSTENIRSGKEEFIRIRNAGAKELRQHLEASRQLTELELEALLREKQMKIQEAKDKSVEFDLRGKLNKKRDALTASNKAEKVVIEQQFELLSEAKLSEEEESRQRIRDHRQLLAARSKHRVGVIKNNVTLCALSKYSQVSQLREHKERERQKFQDVKKRNFRNIRAASNSDSNANDAAAAIFQAAGFHFDESSITDSLDSNELLPGIVNLSEFSFVEKGRRNSAASKAVTGVMIQQSVLSKTVESLDSMLSRSNQKNALNNSKQPHL